MQPMLNPVELFVGLRYLRAKRRIDQAAALVMGGLGLRLAASN